MARKLTDKQRAAADYFVLHKNKAASYRHGYPGVNMKDNTIRRRADELFKKPHVAAYVTERQAGALAIVNTTTEHVEINAAWVLKRAALIANFNIRKFVKFDEEGWPRYDFSLATDDDWYCISNLKDIGPATKDKLAALKLVGDTTVVAAFKQNIDLTGTLTTETYELSDTERSARIAALLDRGRARRVGSTDN